MADRGYVLERGKLVASGPAFLLAQSTVIRQAYLGRAAATTASTPSCSGAPWRVG